jgi:hypothetical protein
MSDVETEDVKSGLKKHGVLNKRLVTALYAGLFASALSSVGVAQTPGYGQQPDKWVPYESGQYLDRLQKIASTYELTGWKIAYLHFDANGLPVGDVDLFRISRSPQCAGKDDCYFVLFSSERREAPLITACQFKWGQTAHFFNPDGSNFWGFEFECKDTLLQVKVTPTHFFPISILKTQ